MRPSDRLQGRVYSSGQKGTGAAKIIEDKGGAEEKYQNMFINKGLFLKSGIILLLLAFSYLRHTYLLNPNLDGQSWLIGLRDKSPEMANISFKSMLLFYVIFGIVNGLFAQFILKKRQKLVMGLYIVLTLVSAVVYGLFKITDAEILFNTGSIIKNFVLSPLFAGTLYIWLIKIADKEKVF